MQQATNYKQLRKGANEATKTLNRGQVMLASYWSIISILVSHWSLFSLVRVRHPGRGFRAAGDPAPHPAALRGQERALRVRQVQAGPGPRLWRQQASHRCQVNIPLSFL